VINISIGNTSLSELKEQWREGLIERCDHTPLFERSLQTPKPVSACLEDLVYLVELQQQLDALSQNHGLPEVDELLRSANPAQSVTLCTRNPFASCADLERNFELAQLSSCAYVQFVPTCGSEWQAVPAASLGLPAQLFHDESFSGSLFYNATNDEYVLAFRGTDDLGDWKDNLLQASGHASHQYDAAIALAAAVQKALPKANLSLTGHSLGGGLASAAALSTNTSATVFNPAALHPDTAQALGLNFHDAQSLVNVTTVDGDLLTSIQEPAPDNSQWIQRYRAPGQHTMIAAPSATWIKEQQEAASFFVSARGIILHAIGAVLESTESLLMELCGITPERA